MRIQCYLTSPSKRRHCQQDRIDQLLAQGMGGERKKLVVEAKAAPATKKGTGGGTGISGKGTGLAWGHERHYCVREGRR